MIRLKRIRKYYKTAKLYLPKFSNWCIYKFRIDNGTPKGKIIQIIDQIRDIDTLRKHLIKWSPLDVWYSSGRFLNPSKVRGTKTKNILLFRNLVFDIDSDKPHDEEQIDMARNITKSTIFEIKCKLGLEPEYIIFSGGKGFQVVYKFNNFDDKMILNLKLKGIDQEITLDKYRVIRLPLTIHKSGRKAVFLTEKELDKPITYIFKKSFVNGLSDLKDRLGKPNKANDESPLTEVNGYSSGASQTDYTSTIYEAEQVLLGSLFGDGSLVKRKISPKSKYPYFIENHSIKQKDYLLWKKLILGKLFDLKTSFYSVYDKRTKKQHQGIRIISLSSSFLEKYYSYFYPTGKGNKVFTLEMLNKIEPLGLAVWCMDDGHFNKHSYSFKINIDKRNIDLEVLKNWIRDKFNIDINHYEDKDKNSNSIEIRLNKENTLKLFRIIHFYIHPSMKYKIKRTKEELLEINKYKRENYRKNIQTDSALSAYYITNKVEGRKRFVPILIYDKNQGINIKRELEQLYKKYSLNIWFIFITNSTIIAINPYAFDKRRLEKIINSTKAEISKVQFKKFNKIYFRISAETRGNEKIDTIPKPTSILNLGQINKKFHISKSHAFILKQFGFPIDNLLNNSIGYEKPTVIETHKR